MDKFQNKYRIPSTRLQYWDYSWDALYFVTICTKNHQNYFGQIENGKMILSHIGVLADVFWYEIKNHSKIVDLDEFVVMPNHIHGILAINNPENSNYRILDNKVVERGSDVSSAPSVPNDPNVPNVPNVETRHALSLLQHIHPPQSETPPSDAGQTFGQKRFRNQGKNTLSSILGSYKSAVSKHVHRLGFEFEWQARFHDHIIRDDDSLQRIRRYISTNVENWNKDKFYNDDENK